VLGLTVLPVLLRLLVTKKIDEDVETGALA